MNEFAPTQDRLATLEDSNSAALSDYVDRMLGCSALAAFGEERAYSVMTLQEIAAAREIRLAATQQEAALSD